MRHLGDITKIKGSEIEPVDVVVGGSPCQDLSTAGKRAGLAGKRSGLFMEQLRVIKEMREEGKRSGQANDSIRPRYMVWENVAGAYSSNNGSDFRAVLEEIARVTEETVSIPRPDNGKWTFAGGICGNGWSIAWRTMDAQLWGVPQRRRRIALVADFGGGRAGEILFERESVSGDTAESGAEGQEVTGDIGARVESTGRIRADEYSNRADEDNNRADECDSEVAVPKCIVYSFDSLASNSMKSKNPNSGCRAVEISKTIDCFAPSPSKNQGGLAVVMLKPLSGIEDIQSAAPVTLDQEAPSTGSSGLYTMTMGGYCQINRELSPTLQARDHKDPPIVFLSSKSVRNLTPTEYCRLQGYPDGWCDIGEWLDEKGKVRNATDGMKYKAFGNSLALPQWRFVLSNIAQRLPKGATLGSLFDGIGGFPLIWSQLNGAASCRWASEIEPFPIAVSKYHFAEADAEADTEVGVGGIEGRQ